MKSINKVFLILLVGTLLYPASFAFADTPAVTATSSSGGSAPLITATLSSGGSALVVTTQGNSGLGSFDFSGTGTIISLKFNFKGTADSSVLSNLDLYENQTKITNGGTFDSNNEITFSNLTISVDGVTTIDLRSDYNLNDSDIGKTISISLLEYNLDQVTDPINAQIESDSIQVYPMFYCPQGSYSPLTGQPCTGSNNPTITSPTSGNYSANISNIITGTCGAQNTLNNVGIHIHNFFTSNEYTTTCDQNGNFQLVLSNSDYVSMSQIGITYLRAYYTYEPGIISNIVVIKDPLYPEQPTLDTVSPDTGDSQNDFITSSQNLVFSGTAEAGTEMEMHFEDFHANSPNTFNHELNYINIKSIADSSGKWTIDFTSKTIPYGNYHISVFSSNSYAGYGSEYKYLTIKDPELNAPVIKSPELFYYSNYLSTLEVSGACDDVNKVNLGYRDANNTVHSLSSTYVTYCDNGIFDVKVNSLYLLDENNIPLKFPINIFAIQTDEAGGVSPISNEILIKETIWLSTVDKMTPDIGINGEHLSSTDQITFSGTTEPDRYVILKFVRADCITSCHGSFYGKVNADSDGKFSIPNLGLGIDDGTYNAFVFWNGYPDSAFFTFTIASTKIVSISPNNQTNNHVTNSNHPTFIGTAKPHTNLEIYEKFDHEVIKNGVSSMTPIYAYGFSDPDGNFQITGPFNTTDGLLADGNYTFQVCHFQDDMCIEISPDFNFVVDTVAPNAPVITSPVSGPYSDAPTFIIYGTCDKKQGNVFSTVTSGDGSVVFTSGVVTTCDEDGTYKTDALSFGIHDNSIFPILIHANQFDVAGNISPDSNVVTLTAPVVTPPSGGGGGGGNPPACTRVMGDINCDEKVDKYDFSLMMMVWGHKIKDNADLNNDLSIDKYDFALLMTNWGYGVKGSGMAIIKH